MSKPFCVTTGSDAGTCRACASDSDCKVDDARPICDTGTGQCNACTDDSECNGFKSFCDTSSGECVECLDDNECNGKDAGQVCGPANTCTYCGSNSECTSSSTYGSAYHCDFSVSVRSDQRCIL